MPALQFTGLFDRAFDVDWVRGDLRAAMRALGAYTLLPTDTRPPPTEDQVYETLRRTDVALTGWATPRLPLRLLAEPARRLRYICHLTGSIRWQIPKEYLEAGIQVTNWGNGPMWFLAEGNVALMLALLKDAALVGRHMREAPEWGYRFRAPTPTLRYKTVGYVGFGAIARMVHAMLQPFECRTLVYDPYVADLPPDARRCASLEALFEEADIVDVQAGLCDGTRGMIGREQLRRLKPHALFINTARGAIVRESELIAFLQERPDVRAGLDVFEIEPLPKDSPLLTLDNVLCYPHTVGEGGVEQLKAGSAFAARNIEAYGASRPLQAVLTPEQYERMT